MAHWLQNPPVRSGTAAAALLIALACCPSSADAGTGCWERMFPDPDKAQVKIDRVRAAIHRIRDRAQELQDNNEPPPLNGAWLRGRHLGLVAKILEAMLDDDKICPRCIRTGSHRPSIDEINVSKTILCWPDQREPRDPTPRLAALLIHERYHMENEWVGMFLCDPFEQHKDYGDSAAGTKVRKQKEMLYLLYRAGTLVEEVGADLNETESHDVSGTDPS